MAAPIPRAAEQWDALLGRLEEAHLLVEKGFDYLVYKGAETGRLYRFSFEDYLSGSKARPVEEAVDAAEKS